MELEKIYLLLEELERRLAHIEKLEINNELDVLVKRVEDIEMFLNSRTRGFMEEVKIDRCYLGNIYLFNFQKVFNCV